MLDYLCIYILTYVLILIMFGEQFYPTPIDVANKMIDKLDLSQIKIIFEPSAGKGDLIEALRSRLELYYKNNEHYEYYWERNIKYFACEIDFNLRKILQANDKIQIVGYDFLDFNTNLLQFDTILMNPPFNNGVRHLLKAWEMLDRGIIVCLLNEETIKNPNSKERKLLLKIIEDNNGELDYLDACFEEAERKTNVKVVMVTLKKEKGKIDSIFEGIEKDYLNDYTAFTSGEALDTEIIETGKDRAEELITNNELLKKEATKAILSLARFKHYEEQFAKSDTLYGDYPLKDKGIKFIDVKEKINETIFFINKRSWIDFFNETDIRSKMTLKVYGDFIREYEDSCIDFNRKNIGKVIDIVVAMQGKIMEDSTIEIFDEFTRYDDENREGIEGRKTNEARKVGKRVVLPYWFEVSFWDKSTIEPYSEKRHRAYDIDKVFANIAGRQINTFYGLSNLLDYGNKLTPGIRYETEFFKVKGFKKGTIHLEFKSKDIRDRFNYIVCASKNWLPKKVK